jgi:Protein of unknown function (DUF3168)
MMPVIETGLEALQIAIYQRLSSDTELNTLISGVYDAVSEDTLLDYVTIGEPDVTPEETKTSYIENIPWTIHSFDGYNGKMRSYRILKAIQKALTKAPWVVEGFTVHNFKIDGYRTFKDIDGQTNHGIIRIRFYIEKI